MIDFFFMLKVPMVPKTKMSTCKTDLFLGIWLYCISNLSQVAEVQKIAKFVEKKSLQSNLVKGKTGHELHKMEKTCKRDVPVSTDLCGCSSFYVELFVIFLRSLVIPDHAALKVSSVYHSSLQRIHALEEFSIPSKRKQKK